MVKKFEGKGWEDDGVCADVEVEGRVSKTLRVAW